MESKSKSSTDLLKSHFLRKVGVIDVMTCRICKKDLKAPKGNDSFWQLSKFSKSVVGWNGGTDSILVDGIQDFRPD